MRWVRAIALIVTGSRPMIAGRVRRVLRAVTPALITAGLVTMLAGSGGVIPVSDHPQRTYQIRELDHRESQFAEMHRLLHLHGVCEETGRWDEWPCSQFGPEERTAR